MGIELEVEPEWVEEIRKRCTKIVVTAKTGQPIEITYSDPLPAEKDGDE